MPNTQSRKLLGLASAATPLAKPERRPVGPPKRITPKLQRAVAAMVWKGLPRDEAAVHAGMTPDGLYQAMRKPHVKAYLLAEMEVLRTSAIPRNFHLLETIAETADNDMAKVAAIRQMGRRDDMSDIRGNIGAQSPGLTIQIVTDAPKPLTINQSVIPGE